MKAKDRAVLAVRDQTKPFTVYHIMDLANCSRATAWRAIHHWRSGITYEMFSLVDKHIPHYYKPQSWTAGEFLRYVNRYVEEEVGAKMGVRLTQQRGCFWN